MDIRGPGPQRSSADFGADPAAGRTGEPAHKPTNEPTVTTALHFADPDGRGEGRITYRELVDALTRRNQSLVRLQLELLEQLTSDLVNAGQATTLFQLERLARRMRRNNENLIALSRGRADDEAGPAPAAGLLRAAVSEVEQHQRVTVGRAPSARIAGRAAGDLGRMLAELLDNATTLSGPETQVTLEANISESGGLLIEVEDRGVGMTDAEIAVANTRLSGRAVLDAGPSSPVGLLVVGYLAERHGLGMTVRHGRDGGVRVTVIVPAGLVTDLHETAPIPHLPPAPEDTAWPDTERIADALQVSMDWTAEPESSVWPARPHHGPPDAQPETSPNDPENADSREGAFSSLFAADAAAGSTEWWNDVPPSSASSVSGETTPIFDEMVSAWFISSSPASEPAEVTSRPATAGTGTWNSAADAGWRVVEAASRSEPASYTGAGLPRRRRGEQLMPGAIAPAAGSPAPEVGQDRSRDAAGVRGRLNDFQHGLQRARRGEQNERRGRHRASQPLDPDDGTPR